MMIDLDKDLESLNFKTLLDLFKENKHLGKITDKIKDTIKSKLKFSLVSLSEGETSAIYNITKTDIYKRMENCLGSHWSMNLIGIGLYIAYLNELQQNDLQLRTREEIHRKYANRGLRIMEMGSTGAITNIIEYLSNLKIQKNYNLIEMGRLFDKIIEEWEKITIFVKSGDTINNVELKCGDMIAEQKTLFFVFAYGSAVSPCISAIAKMNNNGDLKGYLFEGKMRHVGPNKKEVYSCNFEKVSGFGIDEFA